MIARIFPHQADNPSYRGSRFALWILGVVALLNGVIGFNSIFNTYTVATTADGIPLDTYPAGAAQTALEPAPVADSPPGTIVINTILGLTILGLVLSLGSR